MSESLGDDHQLEESNNSYLISKQYNQILSNNKQAINSSFNSSSNSINNINYTGNKTPLYVSYTLPIVVDDSSERRLSFTNNNCLISLGNNYYSLVHTVSPSDYLLTKPLITKPIIVHPLKANYKARQRKNYDSMSKHKILELYEHYSRLNKRMTVRNIAVAIFRDLKKEKYFVICDINQIVVILHIVKRILLPSFIIIGKKEDELAF